ncbi:OmpA family protein [Propioniciclava sinopodophylli]|uniref:OmpA family protein n=1 Tax=Propioniciclava sinopodophylli TaxID=1837344 RepID=UPI0024927BBB|nr:OmpA family protein [Propioniciclava sinopodophylli]
MIKAAAGVLAAVVFVTLGTAFASADDAPDVSSAELAATISDIELPREDIVFPKPVEVITETVDEGQRVIGLNTDILFGFAEAVVAEAGAARIVEALADVPQGTPVLIGGHTDSIGDDASNQVLSQQRAEAIAAVVRSARPDLMLTVTGYGESQPVASNTEGGQDDPEGRALNRRVELRVG